MFNNEGLPNNTITIKHCQFAEGQNLSIYLRTLVGYKNHQGDMVLIAVLRLPK